MTNTVENKNTLMQNKSLWKIWWNELSEQWKKAFNEAMLNKGPVTDMPDDNGFSWIIESPNYRFAGPRAPHPNMGFELSDLNGLEKLTHAEFISVTYHQVSSVQPLSNMVHLKSLFLDNNQIYNLHGVENMEALAMLVLNVNEINSLEPISGLNKLENIQVAWNKLKSYTGLNENNTEHLNQFVGLPNRVAQSEIDRLQNDLRVRVVKVG